MSETARGAVASTSAAATTEATAPPPRTDALPDGGLPRIGVQLPSREFAVAGDYGIASLLRFAREAERLGFDSLWIGDSLTARPRLDPLVVLAAVSSVTTRIGLGTAALTAALRHPALGAHQLASLDQAALGRLTLGVGAGFPNPDAQDEFDVVGVPFGQRVGRLDEAVEVWRRAWRSRADPDAATLDGRYGSYRLLDRLPPPHSRSGPPVWLAAADSPRVLARTAARYDGWLPFLPSASAYAVAWERIGELAAGCGRSAHAITPALYATVALDADRRRAEQALDTYTRGYYGASLEFMRTIQAYGWGGAEECAAWLTGYIEAGARHLVLRIGAADPLRGLEPLAAAVLPPLRSARRPPRPRPAVPIPSEGGR